MTAIFYYLFCTFRLNNYLSNIKLINHNVYADMSTINQLVSEIAHSVQQPDSVPVRRAIKLAIIHARNNLIRKSYGNHNYTDKGLMQRFRLQLIDVPDGDVAGTENIIRYRIKRTLNKVPRPTRLTNNLPFHSVRTTGVKYPIEVAFVREASSRFYENLPGMNCVPRYDYINEYIYIDTNNTPNLNNIEFITVESVFEYPHIIPVHETDEKGKVIESFETIDDDNEFLLPEDMIDDIKKFVLETFNPNVYRDTNELPTQTMSD